MNKKIIAILSIIIISICYIVINIFSQFPQIQQSQTKTNVNIYLTNGTLPTLYAGLNLIKDPSLSLIYYERSGTFDNSKLPTNVKAFTSGKDYGAIEKIFQIFQQYPQDKYTFTLFSDDLRAQREIEFFTKTAKKYNTLDYKFIMLSDGTATYKYFADNYKAIGSFAQYEEKLENYKNIYIDASNGSDITKTMNSYVVAPTYLADSITQIVQFPSRELWLQFPDYLISQDPKVNAALKQAKLIKKQPFAIYNSLSDKQKQQFLSLVKFDKKLFDDKYFSKTDKPYLIIAGANLGLGDFANYIKQISQKYGEKYHLLFKPHPSHMPKDGDIINPQLLQQYNIDVLPGRLPMEVIMWAYPNLKIGGYESSLFMAANPKNVLFFIRAGKEKMFEPLESLINDGYFKDLTIYK